MILRRKLLKSVVILIWMAVPGRAQAPRKLTIQEAEAIALKVHPQVMAADLNAAAAAEITRQIRSAYFPAVFASVTGAGAQQDSRIAAGALNNPLILSRLATGFTVGALVSDFGRTSELTKSSRLLSEARHRTAEATRAEIILSVDHAYYAVLRSQEVLKVAEQTVSARQLLTDQISELAKSKLKSELDVSVANVSLSEAKILLLTAQNEVKARMAELSGALGSQQQQIFELTEQGLPSLMLPDLANLVSNAIQARPDLASLRLESEAARQFAKAERALSFPTLSFLGAAGVLPSHVEELSGHYSAAGLNLNIPIFNGHLFASRHAEAELTVQAKIQSLRDLENRVTVNVRTAWLSASTALERIGLTDQLLNQATQSLELVQSRYDLGLNSIVDLSQAQLSKTSAEIARASAKYDYLTQRAILDFEVGQNH
jgi:outer membrane protein